MIHSCIDGRGDGRCAQQSVGCNSIKDLECCESTAAIIDFNTAELMVTVSGDLCSICDFDIHHGDGTTFLIGDRPDIDLVCTAVSNQTNSYNSCITRQS